MPVNWSDNMLHLLWTCATFTDITANSKSSFWERCHLQRYILYHENDTNLSAPSRYLVIHIYISQCLRIVALKKYPRKERKKIYIGYVSHLMCHVCNVTCHLTITASVVPGGLVMGLRDVYWLIDLVFNSKKR